MSDLAPSGSKRIGFIGLGAMGAPMVRNIARKTDGEICVHDLRPEIREAATAWGGKPCSSPAEVAERCDVVITMLPDDRAVAAALAGPGGIVEGGRPGLVVLDFSTIGSWTMREVAGTLGERGIRAFGGAVSLGVKAAIAGTLAVFLDDGAAHDAEIAGIVGTFAGSIIPTGEIGSSKVVKLISNLMVGVNVVATAEAIALAEKAGLPADILVPLIAKGSGASYALNHHMAKAALVGDVGPGKFGVDYILKDLDLALELGRRLNHPALFGAISTSAYRGAKALGHGAHYYPVVLEWIEHAAGQASPERDPAKRDQAA